MRITPGTAGLAPSYDVVVIGLGVTGAGVALDAVSRGLSVLAVDAHDLAFGTSRWSSKLVHGGLRYLASGQVGVAHESAVERGHPDGDDRAAPHPRDADPDAAQLEHVPDPDTRWPAAASFAGDLLRRGAGTAREPLPRPRRISATEALALAPGLRSAGLRGGLRLLGRPARGRRPAGHHDRPHRGRPRGRDPHPLPRHARDRNRRLAPRRAHRDHGGRGRPRGGQRDRRVGRRPGRGGHAAAQPRHPPRAARRDPARAADRGHRTGPGLDQPLRDGAPPARRHGLRRPHRRAARRPGARRTDADRAGDRLPARRGLRRLRPRPAAVRRGRGVRRAATTAGRLGRRGRRPDRRPLAPARGPHVAQRRGHRGRRQAHDLPADGRGRGRPGRSRWAASTPTRAAPARCR